MLSYFYSFMILNLYSIQVSVAGSANFIQIDERTQTDIGIVRKYALYLKYEKFASVKKKSFMVQSNVRSNLMISEHQYPQLTMSYVVKADDTIVSCIVIFSVFLL